MTDAPQWLRNLAKNYADGVPGMTPQDHRAWAIADEMERLIKAVAAERERCITILRWYARDDGKLFVNAIEPIIAEIRRGGSELNARS